MLRHNPILLRSDAEAMRYGTMVADAYLAAPSFDENQAWRWKLLIEHIERLFERIQRGRQGVKVVFVEGQPYADERELQEKVAETGILYVSTDFNTHPIFDPTQNLKFRAVHDYMTHIGRDVTFGLRGEIAAYNAHAKMAPPDAVPALFTEVLAQASVYVTKGFFPEQKIAILPFDYYNVGIEVAQRRGMGEARANPAATRALTMGEAAQAAVALGVPKAWRTRFLEGLDVEWREHGGGIDVVSIGSLVLDHLTEDVDYYRRRPEDDEALARQAERAAYQAAHERGERGNPRPRRR